MYNIIIMNLTIILYNGGYINTTLQLDARVQEHFQAITLQLDAHLCGIFRQIYKLYKQSSFI